MERVTGIGGFFFRSPDPDRLAAWYLDRLGVQPPPETYEEASWWQRSGPTVFAAMAGGAADSHLENSAQTWSLNFRVEDLDAMVAQLRSAGTIVAVDPETYPNGRFASLTDPDGNPIQLWQPDGTDLIDPGHR